MSEACCGLVSFDQQNVLTVTRLYIVINTSARVSWTQELLETVKVHVFYTHILVTLSRHSVTRDNLRQKKLV